MTKRGLVDQVYLAITGGEGSPDIKLSREEIAHLLPAALNYAITVYIRQERRNELDEMRIMGFAGGGTSKVSQDFLVTQVVTPLLDEERDLYYLPLSFKIQSLPGNRGLDSVFSMRGEASYVKVASHVEVIGLDGNVCFFWNERYSTGSRIYLKNLSLPVCNHFVKAAVSVSDLSETDELPLPGDFEFQVITLMVEFFTGERKMPGDDKPDDKDNNAK